MGAPKHKWTSEEEAALKAGIAKYGLGKWSTILKDPEFGTTLRLRSNVDLKDKWRNLNVLASGLGSRNKSKIVHRNTQLITKHDHSSVALSVSSPKHDDSALSKRKVVENGSEVPNAESPVVSALPLQIMAPKKPISRLDDLILEAVAKLKEPRGSTKDAIALYIEEHYLAPPDIERPLIANLKMLTENGRLIKVKHQYRIAPSLTSDKYDPCPLLLEGKQEDCFKAENRVRILTKAQIDAELKKMMTMTAQEAAVAAALAVAEAEAAIAEAEQAAKEAEEAEAEAEAAQCFAEVAMKALNCRTIRA